MSLLKIQVPPGVLADYADHDASGRWIDSDKIRFRDGRLQNIGGWRQAFSEPVIGIPRTMVSWSLLDGSDVTAVASEAKVYIFAGGRRYDITPLRASGTLGANPFWTNSGSPHVAVAHVAHGCAVGDYVRFAGATPVGGLDLNNEFTVVQVDTPDAYVITHTANANATGSGGGAAVTFSYDVHAGQASSLPGLGYGAGPWSGGTWSGPRDLPTAGTAYVPLRRWWLAPWGEDLVLAYTGGSIFRWDASGAALLRTAPDTRAALNTRAVVLPGAPTGNQGIVISAEDRHLIVLGAGGDPLALQWPNQGTLTDWAFGAASTANLLRLLSGSRIITGINTAGEVLIWTDNTLYGLRYTGAAGYSHTLRQIAGRISIIGPAAAGELDGHVRWMGIGQFYHYAGGSSVQRVPCTIENVIKNRLVMGQAEKVAAGVNPMFGEVVWAWPSDAGGGENDAYVRYSVADDAWNGGMMPRTAFASRGAGVGPIAGAPDGYIYEHEWGEVDPLVKVTLRCRKWASSPPVDFGPYEVTPSTPGMRIRARGRHVAIRLEGKFQTYAEPATWFAESASFTIGEADQVMRIVRMIPDIKFHDAAVRIGAFRFDVIQDGEQ